MTENVLNNTTNAEAIPTLVAQKALGYFGAYMNLARTVARDFEYEPATYGATINVTKRGTLTANNKTAGDTFTKQNPTLTKVSVTLNKHKEVTILIDDVTKVLERMSTLEGYAQDAAIVLAEAVETDLASLHASIENTRTFTATSTATKDAAMLALRRYFVTSKVPLTEKKYLYADSTLINELLEEDKYTRADALGKQGVIEQGALLNIYGFNIFESQVVQTSGSPVAYHNLAYTKDAFVLASRPLPSVPNGFGAVSTVVNSPDINLGIRVVSSWDTDLGAMKITLDLLYGVAILDQRRVCEFESF